MTSPAEVIETYSANGSMRATAKICNISHTTVRKILIDAGVVETERSEQILRLASSGLSTLEIAKQLGVSPNTINAHMPYKKCIYNSDNPSENAIKIRKHRNN